MVLASRPDSGSGHNAVDFYPNVQVSRNLTRLVREDGKTQGIYRVRRVLLNSARCRRSDTEGQKDTAFTLCGTDAEDRGSCRDFRRRNIHSLANSERRRVLLPSLPALRSSRER